MRLLIVEDDRRIAADMAAALSAAGYSTEICGNGEEAWFLGDTEDYDLVILDIGLPGMDGLSVIKRWRANDRHMPVIMLTARGSWAERVEGIDAGADDYLAKPFQVEELMARVRALIRRAAGHASPVLSAGPLSIDTRQMRVMIDGANVSVSPLEYRLVAYLLHPIVLGVVSLAGYASTVFAYKQSPDEWVVIGGSAAMAAFVCAAAGLMGRLGLRMRL